VRNQERGKDVDENVEDLDQIEATRLVFEQCGWLVPLWAEGKKEQQKTSIGK
jgi:hypothetical protein